MARVPFIGRLHLLEYLALTLSFILLFLETIVRSITLLLPGPIIRFFYRISRNAFNSLSSPYSRRARNRKKSVSHPIAQAQDFVEICDVFGYYAEEHIVQTKDGYLLGLHRLGWRKGEEDQRVNHGPGSIQKKVVYLHHGLLMNSEVWVCITEQERCLPFMLVEQGYDVWLGNNRGNKYSKKSVHSVPTETKFWDFSMDQFAFHDIPDSINYVLETTQQPSLSYIGFSQGTAQAFATLSIHPMLNSKVDVFVALAPAMAPPGLASGVVASLCKSNPSILFLAFGRRAILGSATMWQALLYPAIFSWFIDKSLSFLFGWQTRNITPHQKLAAYPHLYSFTATKCVVHWFQIIRNGTFQMFDDEVTTPLAVGNGSKYYKVAKFPTRNIKTPIVLVYGGSDSLVDIKLMLKELPKHTVAKAIQKYEHLDLLWASDVDKLVFPHVFDALESYASSDQTKASALRWRGVNRAIADRTSMASPNGSQPPGYSEDERERQPSGLVTAGVSSATVYDYEISTDRQEQLDESDDEEDTVGSQTPERFALTPERSPQKARHGAKGVVASARLGPAAAGAKIEWSGSGNAAEGETEAGDRRSTQEVRSSSSPIPRAPPSVGSATSDTTVLPASRRKIISPSHPRLRGQRSVPGAQRDTPSSLASGNARDSSDTRRSGPEGWWSSTSGSGRSSPIDQPSTAERAEGGVGLQDSGIESAAGTGSPNEHNRAAPITFEDDVDARRDGTADTSASMRPGPSISSPGSSKKRARVDTSADWGRGKSYQ